MNFIEQIKQTAFIEELEKIANTNLYHYFDFAELSGMLNAGGIIARERDKKRSISTTYDPEKSSYVKAKIAGGDRKGLLRARIIEENLGKDYGVRKYEDPVWTDIKRDISEYEKRIDTLKTKKLGGANIGILPWNKIDKIEVINPGKLRNALRVTPKFISENPRENLRNLSSIMKRIKK